MSGIVRPVFVLGSPRSAMNVVAWSLGQHPSLLPLGECGWLCTFVAVLESLYDVGVASGAKAQLNATGVGRADFFEHYGEASHRVLLGLAPDAMDVPAECVGAGARWITAAPEYSFAVGGLLRVFPSAQFIHVVRGVDNQQLVPSVAPGWDEEAGEQFAHAYWIKAGRAALQAERTLSSKRILRVAWEDLVATPKREISRCLDFLEEPWAKEPMRVLRGMDIEGVSEGASGGRPAHADAEDIADVEVELATLNRELRQAARGPSPAQPRDDLERDFRDWSRREVDALKRAVSGSAAAPETDGTLERLEEDFRVWSLRGWSELGAGLLRERMLEAVRMVVPVNARVLVVSKGDEALLELDGREGWHFPRDAGGAFAGHYPADGEEAVRHLEALRHLGAGFILFPKPAHWWLDHYVVLRTHLRERCELIWRDSHCVLYRLP